MICNNLAECIDHSNTPGNAPACPNKNRTACIESADQRSQVKCEENNKKYILLNTLRRYVSSYKMDGGIIVENNQVPTGTNKCDYLYIIYAGSSHEAILIELKGTDLSKALKQLQNTLKLFPNVFRTCSHVHGRIIVTSALPNLRARPEYVNLVKILEKNYHGTLKIAEKHFNEKDIELSTH